MQPDVILLDLVLPDLAGGEVLRRLKLDPVTAHIPVVILTSNLGAESYRRGSTGFVSSAPSFTGQPQVANGASDLLGKAFGDAGVHARSAVGVSVLPLDAPVEVELVVEVS